MMFLACYILPSNSSTLAAAIHPEALLGLFVITDLSRALAFFRSLKELVKLTSNYLLNLSVGVENHAVKISHVALFIDVLLVDNGGGCSIQFYRQ